MTLLQTSKTTITTTCERLEQVIELLLISLLAFMPLAFGAVEAWSEQVVIALAAAMSILFLVKFVFQQSDSFVWSWAYVPIGAFILVAMFQLIPLPTGLVRVIAPNTAEIKNELLADLPNAREILSSMTLSFYPHATEHDLRLVLSVAAVFVVVVNIFRQTDQIKRLLAAIAIIGGSIAMLALAQDLFGNGKIYWIIPTGDNQAYSGTFVNHSHYGQFMNLSIGAALGLLMVKLHEAFAGKKVTPPVVAEYLGSPQAKIIWTLIFMIILGVSALFVSLTRGGMISMLIAAAFTTLVLSSRKSLHGRSWIMALMALGSFICVLYIGFDAVYDRLATIRDIQEYHGRWQIVKDIGIAWTKFPLFGTGLGTHDVVYPMFDRSTIAALASHAENEYAQAAEETGLVGLALLSALWVSIWVSYVRNVTSPYTPIRSAAYGLGFGLLAILLHSLSDFGQHLPANFMLSAISCALLIGLAQIGKKNKTVLQVSTNSKMRKPLSIAILVCISVVWVWAILGANNARVAESHWKKALIAEDSLRQKNWQGTNDEFKELISQTAAAADYQPENVNYRHWLNVYRWYSISRIVDPNTGQVIIPQQMVQFVPRIISELHNARVLCPVFGATYCVAGQLEKFVLDDPNGAKHIQTGYLLAPCDPTACFVAGFLDATEGRVEQSLTKLKKATDLDGRLFADVTDVYINHINRPDLVVAIAEYDTGRLSYVANRLSEIQEHKELAEKARAQVTSLLKEKCSQPDVSAGVLASLAAVCQREKDSKAAIEYYSRALALDYGQVNWRFNLAKLLADTEQIPEAIHQAKICLRLQPQFKAAERLIAELSVHPKAVEGATQLP